MFKIIGADQKEYGPVSADQLRQWIAEGRANGHTKVRIDGTSDWKAMENFPEFADALSKMPPPPPMPGVPIAPLPAQPRNSQMAVWAMVMGICSLTCGFCIWFLLAPTAIVLGAVSLSQLKNHPELTGRGFAILGIVLGIVAIIVFVAAGMFYLSNPEYLQSLQKAMRQ